MSQEIELKLAIDPRDVPTLRESLILRELRLKHTPRRSLVSVYYDTPSRSLARRGIMLRARGTKVCELDPPEIHRLRIRIKKLRYATDFCGGFWPNRRTERYLAALKDLQEALGEFHDTTVADVLIAHFTATDRVDLKLSTAPVNRWLTRYQRGLRKKVIESWRKFANQKPFWDSA
jgi:CHAD domain-containing protein